MINANDKITIDIHKKNEYVYIYAKQYDQDTRKVEVTITDNDEPIVLQEGAKARVRYSKRDKKGGYIEIEKADIINNVVYLTLTQQMLTASGKVTIDIEFYEFVTGEDGHVTYHNLSTATFYIYVAPAAIDEKTIISSNEFSVLVNALVRTEEALAEAEALLPVIQEAIDTANSTLDTMNNRFGEIEEQWQYILDTTDELIESSLAAQEAAKQAEQSRIDASDYATNASNYATDAKASALSASNYADIAYAQADRSQYYAEQAEASALLAIDAKGTTIKTLADFNANIDSFRTKNELIAESDLTANLKNKIDGKASIESVRLKDDPITEADLDYALALKVNNGGGGEGGGGGIIVSGAQIDDTEASYSKVYSSQKTVSYVTTSIESAISGIQGLSDNNFTTAEKIKLSRIENSANYYVHPLTHPASIITTTPELQFISEVEKENFADKYTKDEVDNLIAQISSGIIWKPDVPHYSDIAIVYPNPEFNWCVSTQDGTFLYNGEEWIKIGSGTIPIATTSANGLMSAADKAKLNNIEANANRYIHPLTHSADMIMESETKRFITSEMYTKIVELDDWINGLLSDYRLKTVKILETDLDQGFLDKVANAGGTIINDNVMSLATTYSSAKIESFVNNFEISVVDDDDILNLFA
jgi:hypothetical protein